MKKLLVVCGPTATGKTPLGLYLAKKWGGEILSADSRQVYRGMDIITGKDLPENSKLKTKNSKLSYYETPDGINIWLLDLVESMEEFSVAQWSKAAWGAAQQTWGEGRLPIVAGGTGFYIKAIVNGIDTIDIPRNKELRKRLSGKSTGQLYDMLGQLDSVRAAQMNQSDRRNPRRLVRAIEIAHWKTESGRRKAEDGKRKTDMDVLMVGLTASRKVLYERVDKRVEERLKQGAIPEMEHLLKEGVSWDSQSMQGLGYKQLRVYFEGEMNLEEAVWAWKKAEHQYVRQQLTWFKRDKRINWFDITEENWRDKVEKLVESWYYKEVKS